VVLDLGLVPQGRLNLGGMEKQPRWRVLRGFRDPPLQSLSGRTISPHSRGEGCTHRSDRTACTQRVHTSFTPNPAEGSWGSMFSFPKQGENSLKPWKCIRDTLEDTLYSKNKISIFYTK
jgi:hypothetical protein